MAEPGFIIFVLLATIFWIVVSSMCIYDAWTVPVEKLWCRIRGQEYVAKTEPTEKIRVTGVKGKQNFGYASSSRGDVNMTPSGTVSLATSTKSLNISMISEASNISNASSISKVTSV